MTKRVERPIDYEVSVIPVDRFDIHARDGVNPDLHQPRKYLYDEIPVWKSGISISVEGRFTEPASRRDCIASVTIYIRSEGAPFSGEQLGDYAVTDSDGTRRYRKDHGVAAPVYDPPDNIGFLSKVRGRNEWGAAAWLHEKVVEQMCAMLLAGRPTWLLVHENVYPRKRMIWEISLQLSDPEG